MPSIDCQDHSARRFLCAHFENSVMHKSNPFLLVGVVRGCELRPAHSPLTATTTTTKTTISLRACRARGKSWQGNELRSENEKQSKGQMLFFVGAPGEVWQVLQAERSLPCKLPVRHVAERACVGVIRGAKPREAKRRAASIEPDSASLTTTWEWPSFQQG